MNELTVSPERLGWLRSVCLALPEASEKVTWGDPTWRVKDKIFAMQKGNYAGGRPALWLKGERGAQEVLLGMDPGLFFVPPYVGHKGWIGIWLDGARLPREVIAELVQDSFRLVAPVRLAARLGDRSAAAASGPAASEPRGQGSRRKTRRAAAPKPGTEPRARPGVQPRVKARTKPGTEPRARPGVQPRVKARTKPGEPRARPGARPRVKPRAKAGKTAKKRKTKARASR